MRTVYSKVTVDRKTKYQIETKIVKEEAQFFVYKRGIHESAHVVSMVEKAKALHMVYPESVEIPQVVNSMVKFSFYKGESLANLAKKDLAKAILEYKKLVEVESNIEDFTLTKTFIDIFGEISYAGKATKVSNLDFTLSNILVENNKVAILDLEWVFEMPVPVEYIYYRAALDLVNSGIVDSMDIVLPMLGITMPIEVLDAMEEKFYKEIHETSYKVLLDKPTQYIFSALDDDKKERDRLNQEIEERNLHAANLDSHIQELDTVLSIREKEIEERNQHLASLDNRIADLGKEVELRDQNIEIRGREIDRLGGLLRETMENKEVVEKERDKLQSDYNDRCYEVSVLRDDLNAKNAELASIKDELDHIKGSTTYRLSLKWFKVRDWFFPPNSKRRLFVKLMLKAIRHPIWFIKHLTPSNFKKFKKYSKSEGADRVLERIDVYQKNNTEVAYANSLDLFEMKARESYPILELPKPSKHPLVSIIIPVYNQFSYTYGCIESIIKNTQGIDYEVIIGDDCSTDETQDIKKYIKNILVARNKENTRFLLNCKNAAKLASGEYIFFLNNDTNVQPEWLSSLLETIQSNEKIGMVGSKLVYPNGALQEAGGILWRDGSAWNYGNKSDPEASEYNYRKPVDYISGAAIMLKKSLWDELGGFDEAFCPAYCEDSDFAFTVRKAGYEVIYDPFSVVVHYEGVSNGTDVKQGVKKYQVDNAKKLYEKWKAVLATHYPNAENVFVARERSYNKKTILMIDHYIPQFDKDAGSRTVYNYLRLMVKLGYNVKFLGENFYRSEPYCKELQKLGIEVLYGPYYANNYKSWLETNGNNIDLVFFNRPHITKKFIDDVKKSCKKAKFIYYGHDLHYVRVMREYELKHEPKLLEESNMWKETEFDIFKKVDLVYYPSITEKKELAVSAPEVPVKVLQPYFFEHIQDIDYNYKSRSGILFVGGFRHGPNFDGIKWFIEEIYPSILKEHPKMVLHVAGSYPPEELQKKANKNIVIEGFVSDERLAELYREVRLVVVPLRYGAGIKGKVIEAMSMGCPVVTTECGAEGIETDALCVDEGLLSISKYYDDGAWLKEHSKKSIEYIQKEYSMESAEKKLASDFDELLSK